MGRFLVTGGCGFIGSHLADALTAQGHAVRILDDLSTGKRANAPAAAEIVVGDIADFGTVREAVDGVDGVFHLAAIASVEKSRTERVRSRRVNLGGTVHVLEAARRRTTPARVVYASSAAVYGDMPHQPIREADALRPISAYGTDKLGCEVHARVAASIHGMAAVGLRLFNVYGPRQDPVSPYSGVISIFAERLRRGAALTIQGDGQQVRDFVAVADVVEFFLAAMATDAASGAAFNVCTGRGTTIAGLAATLGDIMGVTPRIEHAPARSGDIRESIGDPARAAQMLGLRARLGLREGLARLVAV